MSATNNLAEIMVLLGSRRPSRTFSLAEILVLVKSRPTGGCASVRTRIVYSITRATCLQEGAATAWWRWRTRRAARAQECAAKGPVPPNQEQPGQCHVCKDIVK